MGTRKRRKGDKLFGEDPENERLLPVRKTKELVSQHQAANERANVLPADNTLLKLGENENGKELFEDVLKQMATPHNK